MESDYILEVSWGCPSDKWPINGLFQFDQAKAISDYGKRVVFLALDLRSIRRWRKWGLNKFIKNGIDVYEYNFPLGGFNPLIKYRVQDYAFCRSIKVIEKELGLPTCVHVHCCQQAISVSDYCRLNNIPYIVTEHITPLDEGIKIEERKKETLERAKQLICVSNALAKDMKNTYGVDSVVIPNIVDLTEFKYTPKQKTDTFRFLSAASVNYGKGFDVLVKAYAKFLENAKDLPVYGYNDIYLTIMGDGPELNNIKELAKTLGISDKIIFTGSYVRSEFAKELAKSDCFVLASRSETFGIVYIEALATGTPVIATRCGGPEDFVNETNGMLVEVDDIDGLSRLLQSMISKIKLNYSVENTREIIEKFTAETIAGKILNILTASK